MSIVFTSSDLMAFGFDSTQSCYLCSNRKRCFLTLLFINSFVACIYYIHEQNQPKVTPYVKAYTNRFPPRINKAVEFIRNTLDNEYNQEDLVTFYDLVDKEFTLGLRCMRNKKQPQTITTTSYLNYTVNKQIDNTTTTIRYRKINFICVTDCLDSNKQENYASEKVSLQLTMTSDSCILQKMFFEFYLRCPSDKFSLVNREDTHDFYIDSLNK
jgi:hypothetical protein